MHLFFTDGCTTSGCWGIHTCHELLSRLTHTKNDLCHLSIQTIGVTTFLKWSNPCFQNIQSPKERNLEHKKYLLSFLIHTSMGFKLKNICLICFVPVGNQSRAHNCKCDISSKHSCKEGRDMRGKMCLI